MEANGRQLTILLPPSYETEAGRDRRYPVAYVQDGGDLFQLVANQLQHLTLQGKLQEVLYVGVHTPNRNDEYTPWPAPPLLSAYPAFGGGARAYLDELADMVKPFVDGQFRTKPEREHTALIGGSFGGLVSLLGGLWRPDSFGLLGLLSASFWYEGVMPYLRDNGAPRDDLRIYMSVGDAEGIYKANIQRHMVEATLEARRLWQEKGFPDDRLRFRLEEGGTHDALCMAGNLPRALQWLFAPAAKEAVAALKPVMSREANGYAVPRTEQHEIQSRRIGRRYRIFISIPAGDPPPEGFPVLYTLDANASFASIAEAVRLQVRGPQGICPTIVVGIGYDAEGPIVSEKRFLDYTDHADPSELPVRPDGSDWPVTGGATAFSDFIEEELKPAIEALYPVDRTRQTLFGHSLGGYYVLRTLAENPDSFQTYIAGSPSIWWKNHALLDRLPELERRLSSGEVRAALLIGVGGREKAGMVEDAEQLYQRLLPLAAEEGRLRLSFRKFEEEGHVSVIHPLISEMLRFI
ncbi:alpha/beta hydrolase [Paenibacillus sp. PAMC21692]|nr:alpha/beta hydrolase [Paenibacillus sp. PAMC21692]